MKPTSRTAGLLVLFLATLLAGGCSMHRWAEPEVGSKQRGLASWYGKKFHGRPTASGEIYDMHGLTAAHRDLPLGTRVRITNLDNGRSLELRINDRGPFVRGRIVDLSYAAARELRVVGPGTAPVELEVLAVGSGPGRYPPLGSFRYTVQVGAFRDPANAERVRHKLAGQEVDADVRSADGWYRVQVGELKERSEAVALMGRLRRLGWAAVIVALP